MVDTAALSYCKGPNMLTNARYSKQKMVRELYRLTTFHAKTIKFSRNIQVARRSTTVPNESRDDKIGAELPHVEMPLLSAGPAPAEEQPLLSPLQTRAGMRGGCVGGVCEKNQDLKEC
uniref:Uncharacterized protein n=1 Tax=Romanomermis culicivorax TaxID=13658 RepID=A0A915JQ45_ROMCU